MELFQNSFADPLTRHYVPCRRVVAAENANGTEHLPGCRIIRTMTGSDYPSCEIGKGGWLLLDFGEELSGGVRMVTGEDFTECRIRLRFGESIAEAIGEPDRDHAIHDIELPLRQYSAIDFGDTGFRFVRIDALSGILRLHNVIAVAVAADLERQGAFHSSDARLDRVYETCVRTVQLNIQDYICDGIKRDRLVWIGDLHPAAAVILRVFGGIRAIPDTLRLLREHSARKLFINRYSSYTLWYILTLHEYYLHTGDIGVLRENGDYLAETLAGFASCVDPDGRERLPEPRFLDWPSHHDSNAVHAGVQAMLLAAMRKGADMLHRIDRDDAVPLRAAALLERHVPVPGENKGAAALLTLAGLSDRRDVLESDPFHGVSTFMGYYVLLAKTPANALELIRRYWGGMLDMGATSFWEDFDLDWLPGATRIDEFPVPGRPDIHSGFGAFCYKGLRHSLCHGWAAGPAAWCSRRMLGAEPLEPGFRRVRIAPDLCGLEFAEGEIPTPRGTIRIRLERGKVPDVSAPPDINIELTPVKA